MQPQLRAIFVHSGVFLLELAGEDAGYSKDEARTCAVSKLLETTSAFPLPRQFVLVVFFYARPSYPTLKFVVLIPASVPLLSLALLSLSLSMGFAMIWALLSLLYPWFMRV